MFSCWIVTNITPARRTLRESTRGLWTVVLSAYWGSFIGNTAAGV
jgi:hypothetical protein